MKKFCNRKIFFGGISKFCRLVVTPTGAAGRGRCPHRPQVARQLIFAFLVSISSGPLMAQNLFKTTEQLWEPQKDEVYLQEVSEKISTDKSVEGVAVLDNHGYALMDGKIYLIENGKLNLVTNAPVAVNRIKTANGSLWALGSNGIFRMENNVWKIIDDRDFADLCVHNGAVYVATTEEIYKIENDQLISTKPKGGYNSSDITVVMEDGTQVHADPVRLGPISRIGSYSGTIYVLRPGQLVSFDGLQVNQDLIDWGHLPSKVTRDMLCDGNRLFISTDRGLSVLRGAALTAIKGTDGLPVENTTCLAKGFANDVWIGTARGAVRMLPNDWHYFAGQMWLPDNHVNGIAVGNHIVYVATDKGIGIIKYEPYTLEKKSTFYEQHIKDWGHKRLGFIHNLYKKDGEWIREISDNDGGNTAPYLAAMCYKYAVTGDPEAKKAAIESFKALIWLERIVPVDGLFARAVWSPADKDQRSTQGSGGLPAKWYPTKDGKWFWKSDASSDEVTAHFYAVSLFYDLVADGKDKEIAREHIDRIASYIIKNGWMLKDMDGKPTRWGRWNPEYLLRAYGYNDRGLNGLEALSYARSALEITGKKMYEDAYRQLVDWGYPANTLRQKNTFPPAIIAPWDDELAFQSYYTLTRYATDPKLRSFYLRSLERSWEVLRMEHRPWFNFTYGAITGSDCELPQAIKSMREEVLDCTDYSYNNSSRDDLYIEPGYTSYAGAIRAISPREISFGERSTQLDGGSGGNVVRNPSEFIMDYWMARFHGFIQAPGTNDPALIGVSRSGKESQGAKPYDGPPMPKIY